MMQRYPSDKPRQELARDLARLYVHLAPIEPDRHAKRDAALGLAIIVLGVAFALVPWVWLIAIWWGD